MKFFGFLFLLLLSSSFAEAKPPSLKIFKGVPTLERQQEAGIKHPIDENEFCCDRQIKSGDAHEPRYNIEAFLVGDTQQLPPPSSSKGKQ
ncbi:MAG: hypothetical protein ACR2M7_04025 [Bdellovibrionales bacterium]